MPLSTLLDPLPDWLESILAVPYPFLIPSIETKSGTTVENGSDLG